MSTNNNSSSNGKQRNGVKLTTTATTNDNNTMNQDTSNSSRGIIQKLRTPRSKQERPQQKTVSSAFAAGNSCSSSSSHTSRQSPAGNSSSSASKQPQQQKIKTKAKTETMEQEQRIRENTFERNVGSAGSGCAGSGTGGDVNIDNDNNAKDDNEDDEYVQVIRPPSVVQQQKQQRLPRSNSNSNNPTNPTSSKTKKKSFIGSISQSLQSPLSTKSQIQPPKSSASPIPPPISLTPTRSLPISMMQMQKNYSNSYSQQQNQQQYLLLSSPLGLPETTSLQRSKSYTSIKRTVSSLSQYQSTPITKHYAISNQILAAFESHYTNQLYMTAYCVGLQYIETALLEIPKHGYYKSSRHIYERLQSSVDAARVANMLHDLLLQAASTEPSSSTSSSMEMLPDPYVTTTATATMTVEPESIQAAAIIGDIGRIEELQSIAIQQIEEASIDQAKQYDDDDNDAQQQRTRTNNVIVEEDYNNNGGGWVVCDYIANAAANTLQACSGGTGTTRSATSALDRAIIPSPPPPIPASSPFHNYATGNNRTDNSDSVNLFPRRGNDESSANDYSQQQSGCSTLDCRSKILAKGSFETSKTHQHQQDQYSSSYNNNNIVLPPPPPLVSSDDIRTTKYSKNYVGKSGVDDDGMDGSSVVRNDSLIQLEKALFLSGLEVSLVDDVEQLEQYQQQQSASMIYRHSSVKTPLAPAPEFLFEPDDGDIHKNQKSSQGSVVVPTTYSPDHQRAMSSSMVLSPSSASKKSLLQLQTLAALYHDDFNALQGSGRVRVLFANTYQGKVPASTNGCAVIAPLLCIHHLFNDDKIDEYLSDYEIIQVINIETPIVLQSIRHQLGLSENAFLIPSDVHDYLMEQGQLSQSQFLTVTGGNILDDRHLNTFIDELEKANSDNENHATSRKIAATFFFHEHVVAILKVRRSGVATNTSSQSRSTKSSSLYCYEFVDSLPLRATLRREEETDDDFFKRYNIILDDDDNNNNSTKTPSSNSINNANRGKNSLSSLYGSTRSGSSMSDYISLSYDADGNNTNNNNNSHPEDDDSSTRMYENHEHLLIRETTNNINGNQNTGTTNDDEYEELMNNIDDSSNAVIIPRTARIRCSDTEALAALLRWYACSMFTSENISYINQYDWDDAACDFDPRVFQAFVWTS